MVCCKDCLKITKSFCRLYNQLECIQLQLNWKVRILEGLMSKNRNDQSALEAYWEGGDRMTESTTNFKTLLVQKCGRKLEKSFPKLILRKFQITPEAEKPFNPFENDLSDDMTGEIKSSEMTFDYSIENQIFSEDPNNPLQIKTESPRHSDDDGDDVTFNDSVGHSENEMDDLAEEDSSSSSQIESDDNPNEDPVKNLPTPIILPPRSSTKTVGTRKDFINLETGRYTSGRKAHPNLRFQCPWPLCLKEFTMKSCFYRHHRDVHLKIKAFKCPTCGEKFKRSHHLAKHLKKNSCVDNGAGNEAPVSREKRDHGCDQCERRFAKLCELKRHRKKCHSASKKKTEKLNDDSCLNIIDNDHPQRATSIVKETAPMPSMEGEKTGTSPSSELLDSAEPSDQSAKPIKSILVDETGRQKCTLCSKQFKNETEFRYHCKRVHAGQRTKCAICQMEFRQRCSYLRHYRVAHSGVGKAHECDVCQLRFSRREHLTKHQESSSCPVTPDNKIEVEATISELPTPDKNQRLAEDRIIADSTTKEDEKAKYPCAVITPESSENCVPPKIHPDPESGRYSCPRCPSTFATPTHFRDHFNEVHLKIRFQCKLCNKDFRRRCHYNRHHEGIHLKVPMFSCHMCSKRFTRRDHLSRHVNLAICTKAKEKALQKTHLCSVCGKVFARRDLLNGHMKTVHLKLGRRACDQCGKMFSSANNLRCHVKLVHLQLREFVCEHCGKSFTQASHLRDHVKTVHLELREYECNECGKMFKHKSTMVKHRRAVHIHNK